MQDTPPLLIIEFLHRILDIFVEYFGEVDEGILILSRLSILSVLSTSILILSINVSASVAVYIFVSISILSTYLYKI